MASAGQPTYEVRLTSAAARDLRKIKDRRVLTSLRATIAALAANPRPVGAKKLVDGPYRVRDGEYRILYEIDDEARIVLVVRVRDRKDVYRP